MLSPCSARQCFGGALEEVIGRGGARVLVIGAAFTQVARASLAGDEGIVAFMPCSAPWTAASRPPSRSVADSSASIAGTRASTIVLSCSSAFPRACTPSSPFRHAAAYPARSTWLWPAIAVPIWRSRVPYSGPAAPPTLDTSVIADRLEHRSRIGLLGGLELLHRLRHAAIHVRPVVAVADRGIETHELLTVLAHLGREPRHPVQRGVAIDRHGYAPQRSAGVFTGASQ